MHREPCGYSDVIADERLPVISSAQVLDFAESRITVKSRPRIGVADLQARCHEVRVMLRCHNVGNVIGIDCEHAGQCFPIFSRFQ